MPSQYDSDSMPLDTALTPRERQIVDYAAKKAVKEMTDSFYKEVGKTVVGRFLIVVGALAVGFSLGKGFIKLF